MNITASAIQQKMESIKSIFQQVQGIEISNDNWQVVFGQLNTTDAEFRSIAYEAAAMNAALKDLEQGGELNLWLHLATSAEAVPHLTQIHVGLGWALAQQQVVPAPYLPQLNPIMRYRVLDGYGYYEGMFRRRKSIVNKQVSEFLSGTALNAYYQGLGRCMWYLNNGDVDATVSMLQSMEGDYQDDLWRGLGIAVSYVGGTDKSILDDILTKADTHKAELLTGAVLVAISRTNAGNVVNDTELVCHTWLQQSVNQIVTQYKPGNNTAENAYDKWLLEIEMSVEGKHE